MVLWGPAPNTGYMDTVAVTDTVVEDMDTDQALDSSRTLPWWHNMECPLQQGRIPPATGRDAQQLNYYKRFNNWNFFTPVDGMCQK